MSTVTKYYILPLPLYNFIIIEVIYLFGISHYFQYDFDSNNFKVNDI